MSCCSLNISFCNLSVLAWLSGCWGLILESIMFSWQDIRTRLHGITWHMPYTHSHHHLVRVAVTQDVNISKVSCRYEMRGATAVLWGEEGVRDSVQTNWRRLARSGASRLQGRRFDYHSQVWMCGICTYFSCLSGFLPRYRDMGFVDFHLCVCWGVQGATCHGSL